MVEVEARLQTATLRAQTISDRSKAVLNCAAVVMLEKGGGFGIQVVLGRQTLRRECMHALGHS